LLQFSERQLREDFDLNPARIQASKRLRLARSSASADTETETASDVPAWRLAFDLNEPPSLSDDDGFTPAQPAGPPIKEEWPLPPAPRHAPAYTSWEDAAMEGQGRIVHETVDLTGSGPRTLQLIDMEDSWAAPKERIDYQPEWNDLFPFTDPQDGGRIEPAFADPQRPGRVDKRAQVIDIIIPPEIEVPILHAYAARLAAQKRKPADAPLTGEEQTACLTAVKTAIRRHLEASIEGRPSPSSQTTEVVDQLTDADLPDRNDKALLGQRGLRLRKDLAPAAAPMVPDILGLFRGQHLEGDAAIERALGRYGERMDQYSYGATLEGDGNRPVVCNPVGSGCHMMFANTALSGRVGKMRYATHKLNAFLVHCFVDLRDRQGQPQRRMLPVAIGQHTLRPGDQIWLNYGGAYLRHFNELAPTQTQTQTQTHEPAPPVKAELEDATSPAPSAQAERRSVLTATRDQTAIRQAWRALAKATAQQAASPSTQSPQENRSAVIQQAIEQIPSRLPPSVTPAALAKALHECGDANRDWLEGLGRAAFPDYAFDLSKPGGLAVRRLAGVELSELSGLQSGLQGSLQIANLYSEELAPPVESIFRTLQECFETPLARQALETRLNEMNRREAQTGQSAKAEREALFTAIAAAHVKRDEHRQAAPDEQRHQLLALTCLRDLYVDKKLSARTKQAIQAEWPNKTAADNSLRYREVGMTGTDEPLVISDSDADEPALSPSASASEVGAAGGSQGARQSWSALTPEERRRLAENMQAQGRRFDLGVWRLRPASPGTALQDAAPLLVDRQGAAYFLLKGTQSIMAVSLEQRNHAPAAEGQRMTFTVGSAGDRPRKRKTAEATHESTGDVSPPSRPGKGRRG
jgi:hypothetical protein